MERLLTIGVPTYKRAAKLDRQLAWIDRNVAGCESDVQIILSDNASPDETQDVCARWSAVFAARGVDVIVRRNPENVGPMRNIAQCLQLAQSRFTWVIGDDDDIDEGALGWLVGTLRADPELAVVFINYRVSGMHTHERCYRFDADMRADGKDVFEACFRQQDWGLGFMTAQVYRTAYGQAALRDWPDCLNNYDFTIWTVVRAGMQGAVLITRDPRSTYVTGDSVYVANKRAAMTMCADEIEVLKVLRHQAGLSRPLMRRTAFGKSRRSLKKLAQLCVHVSPALTFSSLARLARSVVAI